jgi:hypothetical protein
LTEKSTIAFTACHIGAGHSISSSSAMLQGLANASGAIILGNMSWGNASVNRFANSNSIYRFSTPTYANYTSLPADFAACGKGGACTRVNAANNLGNWLYLTPNQNATIIKNVYFTSTGNIKF